jgi:hypothetical protein
MSNSTFLIKWIQYYLRFCYIKISRKMLNSVFGALVKDTWYSKITLEVVYSMFVMYKKCYYQYKGFVFTVKKIQKVFLSLASVPGTLMYTS